MKHMNKPQVQVNSCKTCGYCVHFCPKKVMKFSDTRNRKGHFYPVVDLDNCIGCGACGAHPYGASEKFGQPGEGYGV